MRAIVLSALVSFLPLVPAAADHALAPAEAHRAAASGGLTIVDVRLPEEWAATELPEDALGVSLQNPLTGEVRSGFMNDLLEAVGGDRDTEIALICASGGRSSYAQALLERAGFTRVHDISEGMSGGSNGPGWLARDLPVDACSTC